MPNSVSGSNETNPYAKVWQQASPYLQNAGLDSKYSTQIGNILNGNGDAILTDATDQVIDNVFSDPTVNAIAKGVTDIVKTVLFGNYNSGADVKEAGQNLSNITSIASTSNQIADAGNNSSSQILQALQGDMDGKSAEIDEATNTIKITTETGEQQVVQISEQNKETAELIEKNQEQIDSNNTQIQAKQQQMNELAEKISAKKNELGINSATIPQQDFSPQSNQVNNPEGNGDDKSNSAQQQFIPMQSDGINDSELQNLITQYNTLGIDIAGMQQINAELTSQNTSYRENIMNNVETTQDNFSQSIEITEEQSAKIDSATTEIVSLANNASSAINEVQNLLKGQFPQLDKITLIKLATSMTKSAICGTNSGLLATAAATMGVGSIFSFGATASKAAELSAASVDQAAGSTKHLATNVAGKLLEQQMTQYMNKTFADISNMLGVDLSQMTSLMTQYVQEQSNVSKEEIANFNSLAQNNDDLKPVDDNQSSVA